MTEQEVKVAEVAEAAGIPGVAEIALLQRLVARDRHFVGVHDYDEVATIDVGRVSRLVLAPQDLGDVRSEPTKRLVGGVDEEPLTLDIGRRRSSIG